MRCGAFGDIVLLTVLLRQLKARLGERVDVIVSGPWARPLLENEPSVGEIFVLGSRRAPYWLSPGQHRLVRWLRGRGAGPTWYADPGVGRGLLLRAGIPDDHICDERSLPIRPDETFTDRWIRFAGATPRAFDGQLPATKETVRSAASLVVTPAARAGLESWLANRGLAGKRFVAIQAGNKRTMRPLRRKRATNTKYWPEERWGEVIRGVQAERPDHAVVLLGVPQEYRLNQDIAACARVPAVVNAADDLPVHVLLPLLERADGMIAIDTGPTHAAAALGCPTVALFGKSDPVLYRPGGTETRVAVVTGTVDGQPDILGITPEAVLDAWRTLTTAPSRA
jgi:heptosyltransferase-2/heptosyltransferase-3